MLRFVVRSQFAVLALSVLAGFSCVGVTVAQCPPSGLPLSKAPIGGLDAGTLVLGQFENGNGMQSGTGSRNVVKSSLASVPGGLFGTLAVAVPEDAAVGIYRTEAFDVAQGTLELWVKPGPPGPGRQYLFSLQGTKSLDGDGFNDLIVGEPVTTGPASMSRIYFDNGSGLDFSIPARFRTVVPRGIEVGDVDGDGYLDIVVSMNQAKTLPNPITAAPGEVHIFKGPFQKGGNYQPQLAIEVDTPQGLVLADFDQDGDLDFVVASYSQSTPAVVGFANNGSGQFTLMSFPYSEIIAGAEVLAAADVNDDGILDILYGSFDFPSSRVLIGAIGPGGYTFKDVSLFSSDRSNQVLGASFGDVNADGHLDTVLTQPLFDNGPGVLAGQVAIHLNNGDGTFESQPDGVIQTPRPFTVSAVKDVNNDGYVDVTVANWRQGTLTVPSSTVLLGPLAPGGGGELLDPPRLAFQVNDAVSMTLGDLNGDGISDVFFRSSTSPQSALFFLDEYGRSIAGVNAQGEQLPGKLVTTTPTKDNPFGEGAGVFAAVVGGTSTYGTVHDHSNQFELFIEDGLLHFEVTDRVNVRREVTLPLPTAAHPDAVNGFHHVQAEWEPLAGELQLAIGNPGKPANVGTRRGGAFRVNTVSRVFRLGSDVNNQHRAVGAIIDELRLSSVRRSQLDADGDGWPDDWDVCPQSFNPDQADTDADGIGDGCAFCQDSLGFAGPGRVTLSVCGQPLAECQFATFLLANMNPGAPLLLSASLALNPIPFAGGTLVTLPAFFEIALNADAQGQLRFTIPGGLGPADVYLQARVVDPAQPSGVAISNAVKLHFLP